MATEEIRVPDIGDFDKVDVVEVLVSAGDRIAKDDSLISLESDKATMDVPAPRAGTVHDVKVKAGDQVGEGDLILTLEVDEAGEDETAHEAGAGGEGEPKGAAPSAAGSDTAAGSDKAAAGPHQTAAGAEPAATGPEAAVAEPAERPAATPAAQPQQQSGALATTSFTGIYASPAVRRFARELGVDLTRVPGSGRKGRILKEDVQGWVKKILAEPERRGGALALPEMPVIDFSRFGEIEHRPLSRIQKISGPNLHRSWLNVPHVTQHDEADITELDAFRRQHAAEAEERGFKLTPLAFIMKAAVKALIRFPAVNSSLDPDGERLVLKRYYHLGIAVDTPDGLVVPVVRDVDRKGIFELAEELGELSARTRDGKLRPDDLRGASFTISSLGGIGGTFFTPVVNAPEVAILGVSRARRQPVWVDGEFVPRLMLPLSLSYDHRVVDGAMAVRFTTYLCQVLADIRRLLL